MTPTDITINDSSWKQKSTYNMTQTYIKIKNQGD